MLQCQARSICTHEPSTYECLIPREQLCTSGLRQSRTSRYCSFYFATTPAVACYFVILRQQLRTDGWYRLCKLSEGSFSSILQAAGLIPVATSSSTSFCSVHERPWRKLATDFSEVPTTFYDLLKGL